MNHNKEIKALTGIRGIAALYVALFHSMEIKKAASVSLFQNFINHGYLSVDLFFILSGFVITLSSKKYFEYGVSTKSFGIFMKKRFARVYPMYFIVLLVSFVFIDHFHGLLNFIIGISMLSIIYSPGWVMLHLWSLSAEWVAYLLFPFFLKLVDLKKQWWWQTFIIIIALLIIFLHIRYNCLFTGNKPTSKGITDLFRCFGDYLLGMVTYKLVTSYEMIRRFSIGFSTISFLLLVLLLCTSNSDFYVIILFFVLLLGLAEDKGWLNKILSSKIVYFLGIISYSLYLIHPLFLTLLKATVNNQLMTTNLGLFSFNLIYLFCIIPCSFATYKFIELPMQKLLNNKFKSQLVRL